ncbi:alpha/beta hydrolase [Fredinandcohnia sp. QZ13]|uniref:alpha/beta hydrolase n=1 Tax=Fredinandcohnia sp. QZ13 TaxID=3073144 RepID=UPI0028530162|nr:alpha/beta hydrolase [Fredinandcohnia sp. QZ13]MDR4888021.1 alpha/beta hydrolase [Fredinandcohnia sp. QZ13]
MGILSKKPDFEIPSSGIQSVETITLGGIKQCILIQAVDVSKPVILFIHGGPSMPLPGVSSKGRDYTIVTNTKELVKNFVVVFWDQRGTGKSYHKEIRQDSMTIEQFISDANELTDYLRDRFKQDKIFLAAHSWGTTIGLNLVSLYPEKFYSYIGFSQIISWTENDRLALKWLKEEAKRRGNKKAMGQLENVGEPPYIESFVQWSLIRKWQRIFNTLVYQTENAPGLLALTMDMVRSDEYSLKDVYHTYYKGFKLIYSQAFIEELAENNFMEAVPELPIPVTFIHGRHDFHVNGSLVEEFVNRLHAPKGKRIVWVEKSAHAFHPEDTLLNEKYLIEELQHLEMK